MRKRQYKCPIVEINLYINVDFVMTSFEDTDQDNDIRNTTDFSEIL